MKREIIALIIISIPLIIYCSIQWYWWYDDILHVSNLENIGPGTPYSRLIEIMDEPLKRETVEMRTSMLGLGEALHYDGLIFYIIESETGRKSVNFIKIISETHRLGRRDRIGIGSTKEEVEKAFTRSRRSHIMKIGSNYDLSFAINKGIAIDFSFDEQGIVNEIRITRFP
jgi:hypothetical protein